MTFFQIWFWTSVAIAIVAGWKLLRATVREDNDLDLEYRRLLKFEADRRRLDELFGDDSWKEGGIT